MINLIVSIPLCNALPGIGYVLCTYLCMKKYEWTIYGHDTPVQKVLGVYFYRYRSNGIAKVDKQTSDHNNT